MGFFLMWTGTPFLLLIIVTLLVNNPTRHLQLNFKGLPLYVIWYLRFFFFFLILGLEASRRAIDQDIEEINKRLSYYEKAATLNCKI